MNGTTRYYIDNIPLVSAIPEVMRFESWYYEGQFKHLLRIAFLPAQEVFQVYVDDDPSPFSLVIVGRTGLPLQVWDLHVGAVIDVLGKVTTLKRASSETLLWLDAQARFLMAHIQSVHNNVKKFVAFKSRLHNPMDGVPATGTLGGKIRLRSLVAINDELEAISSSIQNREA